MREKEREKERERFTFGNKFTRLASEGVRAILRDRISFQFVEAPDGPASSSSDRPSKFPGSLPLASQHCRLSSPPAAVSSAFPFPDKEKNRPRSAAVNQCAILCFLSLSIHLSVSRSFFLSLSNSCFFTLPPPPNFLSVLSWLPP